MFVALLVFTLVVGGGALIWYLSDTAEFSRSTDGAPPKAIPVTPGNPPKATPVR